MWFLTTGPVEGIPTIFAELPIVKELRLFLQEASLSRIVIIVVGPPRCPHGLQFSRVEVYLADHIHTRSGIPPQTLFPPVSVVDAAGTIHLSVGEKNVALSFSLSFVNTFGKIPSMPCRGRIALVFQSLLEICPQISWGLR